MSGSASFKRLKNFSYSNQALSLSHLPAKHTLVQVGDVSERRLVSISTVFRRREQARNLPAIFPTRVATTEKLTSAFGLVDGARHKTDKS
jgi:hypothetical protein